MHIRNKGGVPAALMAVLTTPRILLRVLLLLRFRDGMSMKVNPSCFEHIKTNA